MGSAFLFRATRVLAQGDTGSSHEGPVCPVVPLQQRVCWGCSPCRRRKKIPIAIIQWHACHCVDLNNRVVPMDTGYQWPTASGSHGVGTTPPVLGTERGALGSVPSPGGSPPCAVCSAREGGRQQVRRGDGVEAMLESPAVFWVRAEGCGGGSVSVPRSSSRSNCDFSLFPLLWLRPLTPTAANRAGLERGECSTSSPPQYLRF